MVSWGFSDDGQESADYARRGGIALEDPSVFEEDNEGNVLFYLAHQENWDELLVRLEHISPEILREQLDPTAQGDESRDNILHVVCRMERVPIVVVKAILDRTTPMDKGDDIFAAKETALDQTALHLAALSFPERTEIVKLLYDSYPAAANTRDPFRLRPIDFLTHKIIMREEVLKYSSDKDDQEESAKVLGRLWWTVYVLVGGTQTTNRGLLTNAPPHYSTEPSFLVHACLRSREVPFALTERAVKYYKYQLHDQNEDGDFPLHIVARTPPLLQRPNGEDGSSGVENNEGFEDEGDFLDRVLALNPGASCSRNKENKLPLVVAIESGRTLSSGVLNLLGANPAGIEEVGLAEIELPYLLETLACYPCVLYEVLKSVPEVFHKASLQSTE